MSSMRASPAARPASPWPLPLRSAVATVLTPRLPLADLGLHDLGVRRVRHEQLVVGAAPDELAVLEHEDLVGAR